MSLKSVFSKSAGVLGAGVGGAFFGAPGALVGYSLGDAFAQDYAYNQQKKDTYALIDYQNAYNTPANMRARLEEAGYNPNLALNGVNVQSASGSVPQSKPSQVDLLQAYNLDQQNRLLQAQKRLTDENALLSVANRYIAGQKVSEARAKATMALYNADYAQAEHRTFERTGKIPETYYRTGGLIGQFGAFADRLTEGSFGR